MLEGGQMTRECGTCKKNNNQYENACGYLSPSERSNKIYIAPYFQDTKNLRQNECPVHTYLENINIYEYINIVKNESVLNLSFPGRCVLETYNSFMSLKAEAERKAKPSVTIK